MSTDDTLRRADEARELMGHPLLAEAFKDLEQGYVEALVACKAGDDNGRFRLAEGVKILRLVRRQLQEHVESGELTARGIEELQKGKRGLF